MSAHTPGPWVARAVPNGEYAPERVFEVYANLDMERPVAMVHGQNAVWLKEGEDVANAALIAAAPELFDEGEKALEALHRQLDIRESKQVREAIISLSAALRRARGE
jgi:hypothetical protein